MATRKKTAPKKSKKPAPKKKVVAKKAKKPAPKKATRKTKVAAKKVKAKPAPAKKAFDEEETLQLSFTEIVGDIEEKQALDKLTPQA